MNAAKFSYPEIPLRLVQCGCPGSGNYLLYRILSRLQKDAGVYRSFKRASGLSCVIEHFTNPEHRDFEEEIEHDDVRMGGIELRNPALRLVRPIDSDLVDLVSSLIWSHALPSEVTWKNRTHWFYLVRDGRDVVASMLHKVIRPRHRAMTPSYTCSTIEELLELKVAGEGYVERCARKWQSHVRSFLGDETHPWELLRYEDLVGKARSWIALLAVRLGLLVSPLYVRGLAAELEKPDPRHASVGRPGGHRELGISSRVEAVCGEELLALGYEPEHR